ncbi:MAG: class I SAM-dependent methyltransferase [Desulforhopalus sp.]
MTAINKWDERYGEPGFAYGTKPNNFLISSATRLPRGGSVLCLADGEGRNSTYLATNGFTVTAVDSSAVGMQKAQELAKENGVVITTCVADLEDFTFAPNIYDGVISIFCHLPPPLRKKVHSGVVSSLRKGGVFILEGYTPKQLEYGTGGPPVKELLMELEVLQSEFSGLRIIHGVEVERDIHEGRLHTGKGSVVQLIAIKD